MTDEAVEEWKIGGCAEMGAMILCPVQLGKLMS